MRDRISRPGTVAVTVLAMLALAAGAALGHAELESSDPAEGATITTPYTLTATFDEELSTEASSLRVENANGDRVATGTVSETDDKTMVAELPKLPDGEYEVLWTAVTPDDDAVERGTYKFIVGAPVASAPAASAPTSTAAQSSTPKTSAAPTPAASPAAPGSTTGSGNDLLIALVLATLIIAGVVGFVLYRSRR